MIIDIHTHINNKKSWETYQKKSQGKVTKVVSLPWCNKNMPDCLDIEYLLKFTESESNIFAVGSIDIDDNQKKQLLLHEKLFKNKKIIGIKLYPGYQHFYPSDKKVVKIAKLCSKYNKPLIFHSGDVYDPTEIALLKYSHPIHIDELAKICPGTKIVISHFGYPYFLETAMVVSQNKNVFTDVSGTIDDCGDSKKDIVNLRDQYIADLKRVYNYYPVVKEKTMFGTDYEADDSMLNQVLPYIEVIKKLMNKKEQENAFHKLAEKVYFS
jgi:predicted TIM-barrel fold metal-dependent hydrolase